MNEKEMRLKKEERVSSMKAFFALESAGFSSHALKILTSLASSEHAEAVEAQTLLPDFTFFCSLLYGNLIPSSLSFQSWTSKTKEEQIQLITEHWSHFFPISEGIPSLCDLFSTYISPNFPSLEEEFLLTIVRHLKKASSSSSSSYALKLLEECVVLAERSVPTMAKEKRCVKDISSMVHFVVEVCFAFDETETSLPLLWRLVVTTPELPLPNQEEIFSKLDKIQIALSACDLLRTYQLSATPPLSFLVNIPKRERNLPEERRYIVSLMKGHASLLIPHDFLRASRSTEMTRSPPNQSKEGPSLAEALIVQMCLCLSISRGANSIGEEEEEANLSLEQYFDLIIQLVSDLLELESGILQMIASPITEHEEEEEEGGGLTLWIGAIVLHAILELCPQSVVSCLVERLLYSSSVLSSEKKEDDPEEEEVVALLRSIGVNEDMTERLLTLRVLNLYDSASSISDKALDDAQFYLSKVQSPSRELQLMQAYLDLVSYLRTLSLDIVPVQLKMMIHSPAELTRLILHNLPLDFVSLESRPLNNVFRADEEENSDHEMQSFNGLENSCDGDDDDVFADAVLPAQQLMDLLLPLFKDDSDKAHVLLTVLERCTTRPLDDTRGSCLLCMRLLSSLSSLNLETQHVILEASHRVVETLKEKIATSVQEGEQQHSARRLKSYLRKLRAAMLTNCPPSTLTTLSCSLFEVEAVEGMTLSEEQQLEAAERLLLRFIGMLMIDASDPSFLLLPLPSAAETVSLCGCQGYLTDVVGLLRTVRHHQSRVHDLLERLQRDIQKKMTRIRSASAQNVSPSPTYKASSTPIKRRSSTGNTKDAETVFEGRVQLLMKKGFSRSLSERAIRETNSKEAAIAFAVSHAHEDTFTPSASVSAMVVSSVPSLEGALLMPAEGVACSVKQLKACLDALRSVSECLIGTTSACSSSSSLAIVLPSPSASNAVHAVETTAGERKDDILIVPSTDSSSAGAPDDVAPSSTLEKNAIAPADTPLLPLAAVIQPPSRLQRSASSSSSFVKLCALLDVAEDFTGIFSLHDCSISDFAEQLITVSASSSISQLPLPLAELLLALAIHSDESAFAILRPFLFALPPQTIMVLFTSADVRTKLLITTDDGVSEKVEEGVEDLLWWLHAKRLSHIVLTSDGADRDSITFAAESLLPTLIPHPDRCLQVLATMYTAVNGNHHLLKCEIIKKLAVSVLDSSSSENAGLLKKRLLEDVASLLRINRVDSSHLANAKLLIRSESLFPSALDEGESRSRGIIELSKVLSVSTVAAWSRAVGRLLDISPSELYLRAAWRSIVTSNTTLSSTEDTRSNDMMIAVMESHIRECLARMRLSHRICLCMAISGVLSNPTNETLSLLDSSSLTFGEFNLSPPLTPSCPLPPLLALQLLTLIQDACLCQSTISASSSRAISSLSLTSSNVEAAETATFNLQIKSLLNWCELMISLPASLQAHCRDQLVYFSPSGLEDVIISALTHYEVDVEALLCKASLFLCVRCPTSYQLPPPLFLLQRSLSSIINNSESSIKKAVVDVSTIMGKALAVLSSSELKELFSFVRALLTTISPNSNSERLMRVRRLLRLAKLFSRLYDPEAALVVIWLQTLLLSSFSLSNLPLHEISITTDEDKVILFNRILQNMAEGDPKCESLLSPAPRFRLLVKLLRCWGFSSHSSVPMAFSHFASSSTVLTGLKTAKDLAPPLKLSFAAKHCWEGMFQQLHFIHEWTGSMNLFLLEVLVVDIGVFGWADYENKATEAAPLTDAYAYRNLSILENPTSLTSWLHTLPFLSKTTKTHISLLLGGSFATNVVASLHTAADIDDDITLLLLPLTASPSQLMASTTVFASIVRSYRDRLFLRLKHAGSWEESKDAAFLRRWREHNDEEDEEGDGEREIKEAAEADKDDSNSLESILSEILSSSCSLLPLCFSPLIMVTRLVAEDRDKSDNTLLPEALELYWHLHQRPALMFSLTSGRDFLLENCAREGSCHFFCDRLPECNLRLFGWEQIESINSFISDKLRSLSV